MQRVKSPAGLIPRAIRSAGGYFITLALKIKQKGLNGKYLISCGRGILSRAPGYEFRQTHMGETDGGVVLNINKYNNNNINMGSADQRDGRL